LRQNNLKITIIIFGINKTVYMKNAFYLLVKDIRMEFC